MKFKVAIVETSSKNVIVEAQDASIALEKVQRMWNDEQIVLYPDDFNDVDFSVLARYDDDDVNDI